jgi:hypothetical protein
MGSGSIYRNFYRVFLPHPRRSMSGDLVAAFYSGENGSLLNRPAQFEKKPNHFDRPARFLRLLMRTTASRFLGSCSTYA